MLLLKQSCSPQIRRIPDPRSVPRARARLPPSRGDPRSSGGHAGARPSGLRPLPSFGPRRGRPHVGHGFRAPNPQDRGMPHDAEDRRTTDPYVLSHLPQADSSVGAGLFV